ncbi:tyrosine-type recombinase/integrase [Micromonospora sp. WMMD710]|uniref:tyrosine-type recombinase/integrase n=1 Tax=Micromonospora sp. WMMD710 TaxID=3016085 RepID=UPI0024174DAF|nr:tyrosine-type recombinase/integrase [Micromonospora sp. WMMD710]MDG4762363.1 tyrosine-type recombinase/integrase [Micromonospora sp. WMMD710]MDG4762393.1 tyrosine-type recombinase/integrase [Micromonospora sp. WMMD710]MDG4762409.1 tyrosine-type recombinase/integrase [Micromonospora sp. WMMD710]MDG4762455.1 tyrosine-type recombinase/integrase [Micromonospora sp. WMMD710]MDG4762490.1 tyrosine-type recombinase/integrase [Micromonospora sp. WMMD710]
MIMITAARAPHSHEMLDAFVRHLRDLSRATTTIETYSDLLCRLDRTLPEGLAYACTDELREQIYAGDRKPATTALYRAAAVAFYSWATRDSDPWLDYNPAQHLPAANVRARAPRPVTHQQLGDILLRAREPYRTWYLMASGQGMRCIEISRVDREDITETDTWIYGKGGRERIVPTHPAVWASVVDLPRGPIARTPDGSARADRRQVRERANFYLQSRLRHRGVTMHRLRHWYGTYVHQAAGGDIRVVQELLGHASPTTTQVYVAVAGGAKRAAVTALPLPI